MPRSNKKRRNRPLEQTDRPGAAAPSGGVWQWVSAPMALAFSLGVLVMAVVAGTGMPLLWTIFFWGAVFLMSFSVAHLITRAIVGRRQTQ